MLWRRARRGLLGDRQRPRAVSAARFRLGGTRLVAPACHCALPCVVVQRTGLHKLQQRGTPASGSTGRSGAAARARTRRHRCRRRLSGRLPIC